MTADKYEEQGEISSWALLFLTIMLTVAVGVVLLLPIDRREAP